MQDLLSEGRGAALVCDGGAGGGEHLRRGVISLSDLRWLATSAEDDWTGALDMSPLAFVQHSRDVACCVRRAGVVVSCSQTASLRDLLFLMVDADTHHVLVEADGEHALGLLSSGDLLRALVEDYYSPHHG